MDSYAQTGSASVYSIYRGVWTNWTHGSVFGLTLTLTRRDGDLLIAFVALFVTVVGTSAWRIACFVIHSLYSSEAAQDGLYHQRQAILRNSANAQSGLTRLAHCLVAWRNNTERPYRRLFPLAAFTLLSLCAFALASGFSSRVSTAIGNEVLISSSNCAAMVAVSTNMSEQLTTYWPYTTRRMSSYANYAQQCYTNSDDESCNTFVTKRLGVQITRNASCPFSSEMCRTQDGNILFDTGFLNTHDDLGFNTPPDQRFLYRRTTHCAPLVSDGFKNQTNYTTQDPELTTAYMKYYYGPRTLDSNETATYEYPLLYLKQSSHRKTWSAAADYSLGSREAWGLNGTTIAAHSSFVPIPPLRRPDADVALLFLSANDISYLAPVADPWYAAHRPGGHFFVPAAGAASLNLTGQTQPLYQRDEPAAALGCVTQAQFCNPRLRENPCTTPGGYLDVNARVGALARDPAERNRLDWVRWASLLDAESLASVPAALGVAGLAGRFGLNYGMQGAVPADQWQRDVESWHAVSMAALQGRAVDTATGPGEEGAAVWGLAVRPNSTEAEGLCRSQKIRSTAYSNFSVFGIATIFTVGGLVVVVSWFLEPLVGCLQGRRGKNVYARLEWCANDTLQLQRLAHEELGMGTWTGGADEVPVTEKGDVLGVLDLEDLKHPRLKAASQMFSGVRDSIRRNEQQREDAFGKTAQSEAVALKQEDARSAVSVTVVESPSGSNGKDGREISEEPRKSAQNEVVEIEQEDVNSVSSWSPAYTG